MTVQNVGLLLGLIATATSGLTLREVNIVLTTDVHAWIEGREHEPHFDATLGDVVSMIEHLRASGLKSQQDVFFMDNGDMNDGTALSGLAPNHVTYLAPLFRAAEYDVLNLGNHELYTNAVGCPVLGLNDSGYIGSWNGRYLSSNVVWAGTTTSVGSRYTVLEGEFGAKLLVFGFLYNMRDHCEYVDVEDVATVTQADWFVNALSEHAPAVDAIVVLAHMDYRDTLVNVILDGIRKVVGPRFPVQFLTGHSHLRGWRQLDNFSSSFEPGCKLDTVGFASFDRPNEEDTEMFFDHQDIDGNVMLLSQAVNSTEDSFPTEKGQNLTARILATREALGAATPVGCCDGHYSAYSDLGSSDSSWTYYMTKVVPGVLFNATSSNAQWSVVGNGALVYDFYPGPFNTDDAYKVSPYANSWFIIRGVEGAALSTMMENLNGNGAGMLRTRGPISSWSVPYYVNSSTPVAGTVYDIIYCDYDAPALEAQLQEITGAAMDAESYAPSQNTTSVLVSWFEGHPCPAEPLLV